MPLPETARSSAVDVFKALGDATRFEIFRFVAAQHAPICACDVVDRFQVSQPTISHHMKVLSEAGLITVSRRGVWAYYAVDPQGLRQIDSVIGSLASAQLLAVS
jgi:ArsR family transcriptional regulator